MPNYNYFGGRTPLISDEPAELQYTFGYPQVPELKNQWDVYRVQAQINSNQNQRQAADQELMHASELAKNHPATNAGIFLGNILGTAGTYALANSLPKWFAKKSTPQVNPIVPCDDRKSCRKNYRKDNSSNDFASNERLHSSDAI